MVRVNMDGILQIECPNYNEYLMKSLELTNSPGLKVTIFLGENSAQKFYDNEKKQEECTNIACRLKRTTGKCYQGYTCLYNLITL